MTATQTFVGHTHKALVAVALLLTLVALWMWGQHLFVYSDALSMAHALTWTVVSLGAHGIAGLVEWYGVA